MDESKSILSKRIQAYMVVCLDMRMDLDVDIVFSEFILNDGLAGTIENNLVRTYERLIQRVLALPNRPPMIMMQVMSLA